MGKNRSAGWSGASETRRKFQLNGWPMENASECGDGEPSSVSLDFARMGRL